MRIGIDCRLWNESGVGRYTRNLISELAKIDKKNEYVLFFRSKEFMNLELPGKNFEKKLADVRWHTVQEQFSFLSILYKSKLDLVHFPYFSAPIFYNRPYVVTIHDVILHHFPTGEASTLPYIVYKLKLLAYKFVIGKNIKNAKKIITVSKSTRKELLDHFNISEKNIAVTYEGVDDQVLSKQTKEEKLNKKYFLYVGNAYPHKNLDRLIEAFNMFHIQEPKALLYLVGKEDYFYRKLKQKVNKTSIKDSIQFLGEVSDERLSFLYKNTIALVMPSLMEGFGLPVIEAMANKCLVVASDIPVHREIGRSAILYFDSYSTGELTERMKEVCLNDLNHFSKNIEEGFKRAQVFSWEKMGKETLEVYESSVSLRPR